MERYSNAGKGNHSARMQRVPKTTSSRCAMLAAVSHPIRRPATALGDIRRQRCSERWSIRWQISGTLHISWPTEIWSKRSGRIGASPMWLPVISTARIPSFPRQSLSRRLLAIAERAAEVDRPPDVALGDNMLARLPVAFDALRHGPRTSGGSMAAFKRRVPCHLSIQPDLSQHPESGQPTKLAVNDKKDERHGWKSTKSYELFRTSLL